MIIFFVKAGTVWIKENPTKKLLFTGILFISLAWTSATSIDAVHLAFERPRTQEQTLVSTLRNLDSGKFTILNLVCCNQTFLIEKNITVLNFYAGWRPKGTPKLTDEIGNLQIDKLKTIRPKYILAPNTVDLSKEDYYNVFRSAVGTIWKTENATI
jgi:hypothetical protein